METPNPNQKSKPDIVDTAMGVSPKAVEDRLKFIGKLDWRIILPIGIVISVYVILKGQYPSLLGYIGMICLVIGLVNLGAKFFLRK